LLQPLTGKAHQSYCEADARLNIWEGSVSSSKTVTTFFAWVDFVINGPPGELVMIGKTERTLKRNVIDPLITMYGARNISTVGMGKGEIHIFGRRVYLVGANDERAEQKIRGASFVGAYCDEITLYPESFWIMLLSRLRSPGARLYGTTNPDGPFHWLKVNYLDKGLEHLKKWHFTLDDNPYLDPAYVAALKQEYTGLWYKRFILGLWCIAEGAVYDMWDEAIHIIDKPDGTADHYIVSIDYGTNNPCAFLLTGIRGNNATVEREYYYDSNEKGRQLTDAQYSKALKEFIGTTPVRSIIIDPSAASFKVQLRNDGFTNLKDADNSVIDGIRLVSSMLQGGRLKVCRTCPNLIKEFSSYVWDAKKQVKGEDEPVKKFDHALDALRYAVKTTMGKPSQPRVLRRFI
jgi:PBSX family phage terminase large subunit